MTATPKAPPTEEVYGIAKRMNLDLEKHPLHTHAAIINMLRTMVDHRNVELQNQVQLEQIKANEAAMADARAKHAERDAAIASAIKAGTYATPDNPKPPRQVIELTPAGRASEAAAIAHDKGVSVEEALRIVTEQSPKLEPEYEQVTGG